MQNRNNKKEKYIASELWEETEIEKNCDCFYPESCSVVHAFHK